MRRFLFRFLSLLFAAASPLCQGQSYGIRIDSPLGGQKVGAIADVTGSFTLPQGIEATSVSIDVNGAPALLSAGRFEVKGLPLTPSSAEGKLVMARLRERGQNIRAITSIRVKPPLPAQPQENPGAAFITLKATDMSVKTVGKAVDGGWSLDARGMLAHRVVFPATGIYRFEVRAKGVIANNFAPTVQVRVDNQIVANLYISSSDWKTYTNGNFSRLTLGLPRNITAGNHAVALYLTNNATGGGVTRQAIIDQISIRPTGLTSSRYQGAADSRSLRDLASTLGVRMGAALGQPQLDGAGALYSDTAAREYSSVTPENDMKPGIVSPARGRYKFTRGDRVVDFAAKNGMQVRGHTLLWYLNVPDWIKNGSFNRDELIAILKEYVHDVVGHYRGRVQYWDVANEEVDDNGHRAESFWFQKIGPEFVEIAFRATREADPDALLFYNDYAAEELNMKADAVYALVKDLVLKGVPIDGVGMQSHLDIEVPIDTDGMLRNMQRLGSLGLDVHVSELDIAIRGAVDATKLEDQAALYGNVLRACLMASNCRSFTTWGFTDNYSWIPAFTNGNKGSALPFDTNYQPKPAYLELQNVLLGR